MVRFHKIRKSFGKTEIIHGIDLVIPENALTVFVGPSGCGKSTLLRMVAGLETPTSGTIEIDGQDVTTTAPFSRGVAMVFQSYALYPHMTVEGNMRFALSALKLPKSEVDRRIKRAAEMMELGPYLKRRPKELSGGQRQRVAMGRALVRQPKVYLFDEPLSNLDAALRVRMRLEIARLRDTLNSTAIYVTHDQVEAMTLAHKLVVLRAGKIEQEGAPLDVYNHPANKFVASFLGSPSMNFIPAKLFRSGPDSYLELADGQRLAYPTDSSSKGNGGVVDVCFGIRPEHLCGRDGGPNTLVGRVHAVEHLGDQALVYLHVASPDADKPATLITARLPGDAPITLNAEMRLGFDPGRSHVFDPSGQSL